jgi:hypothetical protein
MDAKIEEYTIQVPVPVVKTVDVQFCGRVPSVVEVEENCCGASSAPASGCGVSGGCGVSADGARILGNFAKLVKGL